MKRKGREEKATGPPPISCSDVISRTIYNMSSFLSLLKKLYLFREEDPLYLWGHSIGDLHHLAGLICVTAVTFWFARVVESVVVGLFMNEHTCIFNNNN
ncbi:hypothetical protein Sjap_003935 [Stephania japonica]|uniref:Uncharacterized protein n=1 Tax=Stephania japonica TaxID=461633 RepID=A0AAP0KQP6_9MAGN